MIIQDATTKSKGLTDLNQLHCQALMIVNADDYGYFDAVSRGILDAHVRGIVSATGIMATGESFDTQVARLSAYPGLDYGVHLNITYGVPLSKQMSDALKHVGAVFPDKFTMGWNLLSGKVSLRAVEAEWRAQIERCLATGLQMHFLNSHEHIHMIPSLYRLVLALAREYGIPHVRLSMPERLRIWSFGGLARAGILTGLGFVNKKGGTMPEITFLGLDVSGRLGQDYFKWLLPHLRPGRVYELMCHPGYSAHSETQDRRLLNYHDWEGEHALLIHHETRELLSQHGIRLVGYRHLKGLGAVSSC